MATPAEWSVGYAVQARADFDTFQRLSETKWVRECHKLQFLQMACEKLAKSHLCRAGMDPNSLQHSHAFVAKHLPIILREQAGNLNFTRSKAKAVLKLARQLSGEIELLAPAVKRSGKRPDNCEYPWEDQIGILHLPVDWSFSISDLAARPMVKAIFKLIVGAIDRLLI